MQFFPDPVRRAMDAEGFAVTCTTVRLDREDWEVALFFRLQGEESAADRQALLGARAPLGLALDAELIAHERAAIVMLRPEAETVPDDPLAGEILLTPGASPAHFEILRRLATQPRLTWFFGDDECRVVRVQQHPLSEVQHGVFVDLSREAVRHDSLIRCTGRYDAGAALAEITALYAPRTPAPPSRSTQ